MSTKITTLTPSNVQALHQAVAETNYLSYADVLITATTATFRDDAELALARVRDAIVILGQRHGGNQHPAKSLQAVRRKLEKAFEADKFREAHEGLDREEILDMALSGEDIGNVFDGDIVDLIG